MARIFVPPALRKACGDRRVVEVPGRTLREVVSNLDDACPGVGEMIVEHDRVRPGVRLAVDGVIAGTGLMQAVEEDAEVHILPAMSGGGEEVRS